MLRYLIQISPSIYTLIYIQVLPDNDGSDFFPPIEQLL